VPGVSACLSEPLRVQFSALLSEHPEVSLRRPLGCHHHRLPDLIVFAHVIAALVHGSGTSRSRCRAARIAAFGVSSGSGWRRGRRPRLVRQPEQTVRWIRLVLLAHTQLRLVRFARRFCTSWSPLTRPPMCQDLAGGAGPDRLGPALRYSAIKRVA